MTSPAKNEPAFHPLKNLPGCMMPDGGDCCAGYTALADDWHRQREAMKGATIAANIAGSLLKEKDARIADLVKALEFIRDGYANQDVNHVDYRVKVYQVALDALSISTMGREELAATPAERNA